MGDSMAGAPWDTQLLECLFDSRVCIVSCFCAPCQLAHQKAIIENKECNPMDAMIIYFCAICCQVKIRQDVRMKYNIEGTLCSDICASLICGVCAVAQQHRQLQLKGDRPQGCLME
eukprot:TRINITY_DN67281_c2_g2_i1.p1 TRINITY_DN67281_c2_g2~~TRINITY_DN67281_c2_g2_i1.p1  ORF type:complete len:116 (-),score=9.13 TRINITY_DN67281_c2_g2_i1:559-906(-)